MTEKLVKTRRPRKKPTGQFHHGDLAEQLIVLASELVEKKGHEAFSMRELAAKLGVTEPAIYRHYQGRDDLLAEVALRGFMRFTEAISAALADAPDPFESVRRFGRTYVRFATANAGWFKLQFSQQWNEQLMRRPNVIERLAPAQEFRDASLTRLLAALPPHDERAADLYRLVWATAHGLATFVVDKVFQLVRTDEERIAAADVAIDMLVDSLRARAVTARDTGPSARSGRRGGSAS